MISISDNQIDVNLAEIDDDFEISAEPETGVEIVEHDGYLIDADTGEVIGLAELTGEDFVIRTREDAERILRRLQHCDFGKASCESRKAVVIANIDAEIASYDRKRAYLIAAFGEPLKMYAENALMHTKGRTLRTDYGKLSFRTSPGGKISPRDTTAAIEWARGHCPDAVETKEVVKLRLTPLKAISHELPADIFDISEPSTSFSIETGAPKQEGG